MPVQETKGSASAQGYGFGLGAPATYIEDVFSTWLYTGNGSTQTITNGIDLAGKGGLVWIKNRTAAFGNRIYSNGLTASGYRMYTNTTAAQGNSGNALTYASNGWSIVSANNDSNDTIYNYVSWTFREQPKFFDIVTYTGNGVSGRQIAHNLGSAPGAIIVKGTSTANAWTVYHRSLNNASGGSLYLNSTSAQDLDPTNWNSTNPTSSVFTLGSGATNTAGVTYVAYLFAHDAGGFGLSGNENVISCGSYVGSNTTDVPLNLGYEPQFMLIKNITTGTTDWYIADIMRGMAYTGIQPLLAPNLSDAETAYSGAFFKLRANGVDVKYGSGTAICSAGNTYIYIAIRRGPMKTPTIGTSVFSPTIYSGNNTNKSITGVGFATDLIINKPRANTLGAGNTGVFWDRLRGFPDGSTNPGLVASSTADEATWASLFNMFGYINNTNSNPQDGYQVLNGSTDGRYVNYSSEATGYISWSLKRVQVFLGQ